ncbi:MAG TPA: ABC transporter permease [Candidatus Angelobacter sp.]
MNNIRQDIQYALRTMRKSPGFTAVAVLTLALGIGANTAIFTLVNAVFFRPIPVRDPGNLVSIFTTDERNRSAVSNILPVSFPNGDDLQHRAQSFSGVSMYSTAAVSMTVNGQPESLTAQTVSGNYFDVLGVQAELGRTFRPEEDAQPGAFPVIVLNYGLWERKFGGDRNVIGKTVLLNGLGFSVIGVAPRGFQGVSVLGGPDLWVPLAMHDQIFSGLQKVYFNERRFLGFLVVGRLKDGVTTERARSELSTLGSALEHDFPLPNKGRSFTTRPLVESTINPNLRSLFTKAGQLMMAVVGLVLLIACANIANLLLARAAGRKREISVRLALGATRARIITQLLTEAFILAMVGAVLGIGLAVVARNLLWKFRPPFLLQANLDLGLDARVLWFTLAIAVFTGLLFGLAPALRASRPDLVSELKERTGGEMFSGKRFSVSSIFVMAQVAFSLIALVGAGLFLMSLRNAQQIDPGFDTRNLAMLSFDLGSLSYDPPRIKEFERRSLEVAQALPGVKAATFATNIPLFGGAFARSIFPEGQEDSSNRNGVLVSIDSVSENYLRTMGIPLVQGDDFDSTVREDSPKVAIINQTAARRFWPNQPAVGKRFKFYGTNDWMQVIGVSQDSKYTTLGEDPTPYIYLPLIQTPSGAVTLFFRTGSDPNGELSTVRSQIQSLDRNLPLTNVWPVGEVISQALWAPRFGASLLAIFALLALTLCSIGIYGVIGYSVGQRIREIGIRMALGAQRRDVLLMVLKQSALMLAVGLVVGLGISFWLARVFTSLMYGVNVNAPGAFVAMGLLMALLGLLASYLPARRAASVSPIVALHNE